MINMHVILKVCDICINREKIMDLLIQHSIEYCRSDIGVTVNIDKNHVYIDYARFAETTAEAIEDIIYELNKSDLMKYFVEIGVN